MRPKDPLKEVPSDNFSPAFLKSDHSVLTWMPPETGSLFQGDNSLTRNISPKGSIIFRGIQYACFIVKGNSP
jgi:hypothetical protein